MDDIKYVTWQDVFTGMWYANLMGGEFSNCYGQGSTEVGAINSLKVRVYQLRGQRDGR